MRIVFLGSPAEVISPLQQLMELAAGGAIELAGVVSQPAKPSGRKGVLTDPPLAQYAKNNGLKLLQPESISHPDALAELKSWNPDVCITAAFGQILSEGFLAVPKRATLNIHPSLLPAYRGATPVPAALLDGLTRTGVTILFTVRKLDAGPIILQESYPIEEGETNLELTPRLFAAGARMLPAALDLLRDPHFEGTAQDQSAVTFCRKIGKEDGRIDWHRPAAEIYRRFRAFNPWPGSFTFSAKGRLALTAMTPASSEQQGSGLAPGKFYFDRQREAIVVGTAAGDLLLTRLKPAGSKEIEARAFWNGLGLKQQQGEFYDDAR